MTKGREKYKKKNRRKGRVGKKNETGAVGRVVKMKEKVADGEWKSHVMGAKEKGKQWRHERELCLLVLQWRVTQSSHMCTHAHTSGCEEHVTELHCWALRVKCRTLWKS